MTLDQAVEYALSEHESSTFATRTTVQTSSDTARSPVLTRRETEVAMLVAQGLTNRQIAQELFVSKRTVDHHVSNVLKKLTITSREQVGYRLTDHQPHLR